MLWVTCRCSPKPQAVMVVTFRGRWIYSVNGLLSSAGTGGVMATPGRGQIACIQYKGEKEACSLLLNLLCCHKLLPCGVSCSWTKSSKKCELNKLSLFNFSWHVFVFVFFQQWEKSTSPSPLAPMPPLEIY